MSSTAPFDAGLFDFTLRYRRTPGAQYHVRPLSLLQQELLYRCDGRLTIADLSDATKYTRPEIRVVLSFLIKHGLVQTLMPEAWLFKPPLQQQISSMPTRPLPSPQPPASIRRFLNRLNRCAFWGGESAQADLAARSASSRDFNRQGAGSPRGFLAERP